VNHQPRPFLSIVIPAYNEEDRLLSTLQAVDDFLATRTYSSEVIVADDGSTDRTAAISNEYEMSSATYRVLALPHRGKASAVRDGILASNGEIVMFTDADLSTPMSYLDKLMDALAAEADVAIGSREGDGSERVGEPFYRHAMGRVFNTLVRLIAVPGINDTQCGFKAFNATVAQDLFSSARLHAGERHINGPRVTGFDVEILFLARKRGYDIVEIPVEWTHVAGSKVAPLGDSVRMFTDVLRVRYNALRGRYDGPS
jgi:glycosyltransferase involved in cell wall biosynthesis